jgi:Flp pilus assembly pilin Flp
MRRDDPALATRLQNGRVVGERVLRVEGEIPMSALRQFIIRDEAVDMVEYALLAGLLSLACVFAVETVGTKIIDMFGKLSTKMSAILP